MERVGFEAELRLLAEMREVIGRAKLYDRSGFSNCLMKLKWSRELFNELFYEFVSFVYIVLWFGLDVFNAYCLMPTDWIRGKLVNGIGWVQS